MKHCIAPENNWETERYLFRQAFGNLLQVTNDLVRRAYLAQEKEAIEIAKGRYD
jgi:hypothetical protein